MIINSRFATLRYFKLTSLTKSFIYIYKFLILCWFLLTNYLFHFWICELQVILSGDVELNPGPKPNSGQNFSICHWNLNSIPAHNFLKNSLLNAYNSLHKFDIICLSETYLDSSILPQDPNLEMQRYTLIRADHASNIKRGGVCVYYKNHLPLKLLNIHYLQECIPLNQVLKTNFVLLLHFIEPQVNHTVKLQTLNVETMWGFDKPTIGNHF